MAAKTKELATIAEDSGNEGPISMKKPHRVLKRIIMEETDSDGFGPPLRNWIPKSKRGGITGEALDKPEDTTVVEENNSLPPSKKAKIANVEKEVENPKPEPNASKKKKVPVREAIAAMTTQAGGKKFGDGPAWLQRGEGEERQEENGGGSFVRRPNKKGQIGLPSDAT
jgi:hypothetical protein